MSQKEYSAHAIEHHPVPPMTSPDGSYWEQPSRELITVDKTHALMSLHTFKQFHEYSCSIPTGAYEGKMWIRHNGAFDRAFIAAGFKPEWWLMWYGFSDDPDSVSINHRKIILSDADIDNIKGD